MTAKSDSQTPFCGIALEEVQDAGLYLGQPAKLTLSWPNPAIYLDPVYWAELQRRNIIAGQGTGLIDLNLYRQEQPPGYPWLTAAAC